MRQLRCNLADLEGDDEADKLLYGGAIGNIRRQKSKMVQYRERNLRLKTDVRIVILLCMTTRSAIQL